MLSVALITLGDPARLTGGYLYHQRMAEAAGRHCARLEFVAVPDLPFPLALLTARRALGRAEAVGASVIVLDSIVAAYVAPWIRDRRPSSPVVAMLHQPPGGIDHGPFRTACQALFDRRAYRRTRRLLAASQALADQLVAEGFPPGRVRVIPPGRDVAERSVPPEGDLRQGRRLAFLCVANWVPRKGLDSLLEAFSRLSAATGTLHLAGDDRADPRFAAHLRARLAQADLAGRVVVHGPLSRERVAGLYAATDVFVLPSLREPYGTVYGEAMAAGLPVVGWRAGNLPNLATHECEGLLASPGDLAGLAAALQRLADDEPLRLRLGTAARRRAAAWPTWEQSAELFFGALREVLDEPT